MSIAAGTGPKKSGEKKQRSTNKSKLLLYFANPDWSHSLYDRSNNHHNHITHVAIKAAASASPPSISEASTRRSASSVARMPGRGPPVSTPRSEATSYVLVLALCCGVCGESHCACDGSIGPNTPTTHLPHGLVRDGDRDPPPGGTEGRHAQVVIVVKERHAFPRVGVQPPHEPRDGGGLARGGGVDVGLP